MATTLSKPNVEGDVVIRNYDPEYTMKSVTITNNTGATQDILPGQPFNESGGVWDPTQDTEEASTDGFCMDKVENLANNGTKVVRMLVRGPAVLNQSALPQADLNNGTAYSMSALIARAAALSPPIIVKQEPTKISEQTS